MVRIVKYVLLLATVLAVPGSSVQVNEKTASTLEAQTAGPKYSNKPRVRREWRTLDEDTKSKVAKAYWTLKTTSTSAGRKKYGKHFNNHDELLYLHSCAVMDPRCDQGHFGPQFMTFHRALLLKYELALLSVDPSIGAMPYWHMPFDSVNGLYRNDPEKYIFTDKFFGDYYGDASKNYTVTNGLFAYWPIAEWTSKTFGSKSPLAKISKCAAKEYFVPPKCSDAENAKTLLRNHQDCTPHVARYPEDPDGPNAAKLGGSYEIVYSEADFLACTDPKNVPTWMAWQNCIEISTISCNKRAQMMMQLSLTELQEMGKKAAKNTNLAAADAATQAAATLVALVMSGNGTKGFKFDCSDPMLKGYFVDAKGKRSQVNAFHSQAHIKFGKDLLDVTTSPNEAAAFTGYHSDIDRSNFLWMESVADTLGQNGWTYPKDQYDVNTWGGKAPYGTSGPYGLYDVAICGSDNTTFSEYSALESPWLPGTLANDIMNEGFPFFDLFECGPKEKCDGGKHGYTHGDILYWTSPERTPYTYDTLEHLYY